MLTIKTLLFLALCMSIIQILTFKNNLKKCVLFGGGVVGLMLQLISILIKARFCCLLAPIGNIYMYLFLFIFLKDNQE